jgi:hypothetical protein
MSTEYPPFRLGRPRYDQVCGLTIVFVDRKCTRIEIPKNQIITFAFCVSNNYNYIISIPLDVIKEILVVFTVPLSINFDMSGCLRSYKIKFS